MNTLTRTFLLSLFLASCSAFNLTTPSPSSVGQLFSSQWNANNSEFETSTTKLIGVVLLAPLANIPCPKGLSEVGFDLRTVFDGYAIAQKPDNANQDVLGGNLTFGPQKPGIHILCAYINAPGNFRGSQSQDGRGKGFDFGALSLVFETPSFNVTGPANQGPPISTAPAMAAPSNTPMGDGLNQKDKNWNDDGPNIAAIVGGVVGGVAIICILIAVFFYRRFRYQKKLNQFHKEHQLLHQTPPTSILASTLTSPNRYPGYGAASPPPAGPRSPGSPTTIRPTSHVPFGFDEAMQKSYHFPSVGSSPSSYSVPLPHEPVLRAQHGPGVGASNV